MTKFLQINDPHMADHAPRHRTETYLADTYAELTSAFALAARLDVAAICLAGDLFHIPAASRVSHRLVGLWLDLFDSLGSADVLIVPGNHDLAAGRLDSLATQPLGVLAHHPKVRILHSGASVWVQDTLVAGVEWQYRDPAIHIRSSLDSADTIDLLLTHAPVLRRPTPHYETIQPEALQELAYCIAYGHIHEPAAPFRGPDGTFFSNPGALSRAALSSSDLQRMPQVALITIDKSRDTATTVDVQYQAVPGCKPPAEIFRLEEAARREENDEVIQRFVESLRSAEMASISVEALAARARSMTDDPEVAAMAVQLLYGVAP